MLRNFWDWINRLFEKRKATYIAQVVVDTPDQVQPNILYLVGEENDYWVAMLCCPCQCGAVINLPMSPDGDPCWKFIGPLKLPNLFPSIDRLVGCRSHFSLVKGIVHWHSKKEE